MGQGCTLEKKVIKGLKRPLGSLGVGRAQLRLENSSMNLEWLQPAHCEPFVLMEHSAVWGTGRRTEVGQVGVPKGY